MTRKTLNCIHMLEHYLCILSESDSVSRYSTHRRDKDDDDSLLLFIDRCVSSTTGLSRSAVVYISETTFGDDAESNKISKNQVKF